MARLPLPPVRVVPPEGLPEPPTATEATASPTTMVLNYLQSRGFQPTSENVRRALEANAKDPGLIPGLRSDTAATEEDDQAAMRAAGKGGSRSGGGGGGGRSRSTLPVDLGHGPTNEADWQPTTTSASPIINTPSTIGARPDLQNVTNMQNATNPAMAAAVPEVPPPPRATQPAALPEVPPPPSTTPWGEPVSPWGAPRAPRDVAAQLEEMNTRPPPVPPPPSGVSASIDDAVAPRSPGLQVENVSMPPPQQTIQAPSADSMPPSGGLNIEDRMMPGRGNLTIQAPSASSMPATTPPVIEETTPILNRIVRGGVTGAGVGRLAGAPGAIIGGIAGAAPGLWDLGRHIVGR